MPTEGIPAINVTLKINDLAYVRAKADPQAYHADLPRSSVKPADIDYSVFIALTDSPHDGRHGSWVPCSTKGTPMPWLEVPFPVEAVLGQHCGKPISHVLTLELPRLSHCHCHLCHCHFAAATDTATTNFEIDYSPSPLEQYSNSFWCRLFAYAHIFVPPASLTATAATANATADAIHLCSFPLELTCVCAIVVVSQQTAV